jgi:TonB family protein
MERLSGILRVIAALFLGATAASNAQAQRATPDLPVRPIMSTRTMPPYPTISQRLGEQGTSQLRLSINANGYITNCQITKSSGAERLDAVACGYVARHWRYQPATHNGKPIASSDGATLVWVRGADGAILKH